MMHRLSVLYVRLLGLIGMAYDGAEDEEVIDSAKYRQYDHHLSELRRAKKSVREMRRSITPTGNFVEDMATGDYQEGQ